jgi:hypothetical protein
VLWLSSVFRPEIWTLKLNETSKTKWKTTTLKNPQNSFFKRLKDRYHI